MKRNPNEFIKQRKQNSDLNYNQHYNINARQRTEETEGLYIITWSNQRNREQVRDPQELQVKRKTEQGNDHFTSSAFYMRKLLSYNIHDNPSK